MISPTVVVETVVSGQYTHLGVECCFSATEACLEATSNSSGPGGGKPVVLEIELPNGGSGEGFITLTVYDNDDLVQHESTTIQRGQS